MKTLIIAAALGLGSLLTTSVSAQTPAPAKQATAHKTSITDSKSTATHERDAKGHFTKAEAAKPATAKTGTATAKPATVRQRNAKGQYMKAGAAKSATVKSTQPRDAKGRFVKKTDVPAPASK